MTDVQADFVPVSGDHLDWRAGRRISEEEIFAALIRAEVREGSLTPARRRRLVRYAAHLRISAVDVGEMITQCRAGLEAGTPRPTPRPPLKLVPPPETRGSGVRISGLVAAALAIDVLIMWLAFYYSGT
jgi:hypothetical protein